MLKPTGPGKSLLRHALDTRKLHLLTESLLRRVLLVLQTPLIKFGDDRAGTKKSVMWTIILKLRPDLSVEQQTEILMDMIGVAKTQKKDHVPDELADRCLRALSHTEVQESFKGLRDRLDEKLMSKRLQEFTERHGSEHARKMFETPSCIRELRPNHKGCRIVMDWGRSSFESYYPGGTPRPSTSMTWDDKNPNATKLAALTFAVDFAWRNHQAKGRVPCRIQYYWFGLSSV